MATNLVISGGPLHDFASSSRALVDVLGDVDVESTVFEDPHEALDVLADRPEDWDLVTVNGLHWQVGSERHGHLRDRWAFTLSDAEADTIDSFVHAGGGLLACHTAVICFDGEERWTRCIGAAWNWDRSSHPPLGPVQVVPTAAAGTHPLTAGLAPFTTVDEVYGFLHLEPDIVPLLTSRHGGTEHPVVWARHIGGGRVVTDLLGHDAAALTHPTHQEILRRSARWLTEPDGSPPGDRGPRSEETTP